MHVVMSFLLIWVTLELKRLTFYNIVPAPFTETNVVTFSQPKLTRKGAL